MKVIVSKLCNGCAGDSEEYMFVFTEQLSKTRVTAIYVVNVASVPCQ
jgi:hypothetical protein